MDSGGTRGGDEEVRRLTPPGPVFDGVGVALVTVFDDDGRLDAPATAGLAARLVDAGLRAVVVAGTTGEAFALDRSERIDLLRAVVEAVGDRVPVVAGTGATTSADAVGLTRDACDNGASAVMALSPPGADADDVRRYYDAVAAAATVPVHAYHFPRVSAPGIPIDVLPTLPIAGVKDSTADADRMVDTLGLSPAVPLYVGSAALLALAGPIGATGAILAVANVEPELSVRAFSGDMAAQREIVSVHRRVKGRGIRPLKLLVEERFGTSAVVRD